MDFAKSEGYVPKRKRCEQDKNGKLATDTLATEDLDVPIGTKAPMLPDSLEAWTKKTQMCATETHQAKHEPDQVEKLKRKLKES